MQPETTETTEHVITYGHHANKRPDLAIDAFAQLTGLGFRGRLVILGTNKRATDDLRGIARHLGIDDKCEFPGSVGDTEYHTLIASSAALMLLSSDEGFGLPVVEAAYFNVPSVVSADSGLEAIHGRLKDLMFPARPNRHDVAAALQAALAIDRRKSVGPSARWSWAQATATIRTHIENRIGEVGSS